jgi:hypothetical protein
MCWKIRKTLTSRMRNKKVERIWKKDLVTYSRYREKCRLLGCWAMWLFLRTDVWKEYVASIIRVTRIGEIGTTLAVTSNRSTLRRNTSVAIYCERRSWLADCHPDDGRDTFLRNVSSYKIHTASHPRQRHSSQSRQWKHQLLLTLRKTKKVLSQKNKNPR